MDKNDSLVTTYTVRKEEQYEEFMFKNVPSSVCVTETIDKKNEYDPDTLINKEVSLVSKLFKFNDYGTYHMTITRNDPMNISTVSDEITIIVGKLYDPVHSVYE